MIEGMLDFDGAIEFLSENLKKKLSYIGSIQKEITREVRVICGCPLQIVDKSGTRYVTSEGKLSDRADTRCYTVTRNDVEETFRRICGYSVHTYQNEIRNGYITLKGGHRAGICGTAVLDGNKVTTVKDISSINIRIARQITGVCEKMLPSWVVSDPRSLIIAGPPCSGKTTLLRDVARALSALGKRVCVVDERGELSAVFQGCPQNDLGNCCDVLNYYPKPFGIMTALRAMSPDVIVCDEIGGYEEAQQIKSGLNCGVRFILTAHCFDGETFFRRPQINELLESKEFSCVAFLKGGANVGQPAEIITIGKERYEIGGSYVNSSVINGIRGINVRA